MSVAAASTSATLTADEIIVESALGGLRYCLANFNKTINLATTGAGGMDTGSAPASGYVALYAIYNPTTQTSALLAKNATSAVQPNVYGGANMPTGYTASALVSVWPTNGSGQLVVGHQIDRTVSLANVQVLSTTTQQPSLTALNISAAIPPNARNVSGWVSNIPSSSGTATTNIAGSAAPIGAQQFQGAANASFSFNSTFVRIPTVTSQTIYYSIVVSAGTMSASIYVTSFEF
ncbi:phage tail protein [Burkholderia vietnamiensis]|nr:phage tail protein [Burkholderia vietnamiensis]